MGYHTNAVLVRGRKLADLAKALPDVYSAPDADDERLSFDEAVAGSLEPDCAVAEIGDWLVVWDPIGQLSFGPHGEDFREQLFAHAEAMAVTLEGSSDLYAFHYYADGKLIRALTYEERNRVIEDEGAPLPVEKDITLPKWGRDESWIFTLIERVTGLGFDQLDGDHYLRILFG
jgi:hypothetical protein